jgi:hypothetical protein
MWCQSVRPVGSRRRYAPSAAKARSPAAFFNGPFFNGAELLVGAQL